VLDVTVTDDQVKIGPHFSVTFERTLRIPDDGREYPLPPSLGHFPVRRVADYADRVPEAWRAHGGVFLPMYQREAMWLNFHGADWRPNAVGVVVGRLTAPPGQTWDRGLAASRDGAHDYVVVPSQPWLLGLNAGGGHIKQFVAMPLGMGYTVEGQVTGEERHGGLQLICFDPKPGRFPDRPPRPKTRLRAGGGTELWALSSPMVLASCAAPGAGAEMGLAAGGRMRQHIYPDPHGLDTWDQANYGRLFVHIVNSQLWTQITGEPMPSTPADARAYTSAGLPWFEIYDDGLGDIPASDVLANVKSVAEKDSEHGFSGQQDDTPIDGLAHVITHDPPAGAKVTDGAW